MTEKFTIVAFRYDQKNSVLYKTSDKTIDIVNHLVQALEELNADVISIRRVMEKRPT